MLGSHGQEYHMNTGIFASVFFLANKDLLLRIDTVSVLGREKGSIILEENELLSSIHCEFRLTPFNLYVKDLASANGVFVNGKRITSGADVKLEVGDVVKVGSDEFILFDNEAAAKEVLSKVNRRKHPRPKHLTDPINLLNFFASFYVFRGIYAAIILAAVTSFVYHLELGVKAPEQLRYLENIYADGIVFAGVKMVFVVWLLCLGHSFLMALYLNRNSLRITLGSLGFALILMNVVDFSYGPLWGIKRYLVHRTNIQRESSDEKAIMQLKSLIYQNHDLGPAYRFTMKRLTPEEKIVLEGDYKSARKLVYRKISSLEKDQ